MLTNGCNGQSDYERKETELVFDTQENAKDIRNPVHGISGSVEELTTNQKISSQKRSKKKERNADIVKNQPRNLWFTSGRRTKTCHEYLLHNLR